MGPLERRRIVPPLAERLHEIGDGRTVHLRLDVVPWRSRPVRGIQDFRLRVAFVALVVAAAVAEVDPTDEGDILFVAGGAAGATELLVVRAAAPDAFVQEQDLPPASFTTSREVRCLPLVEPH